jgi:hypothetical protein
MGKLECFTDYHDGIQRNVKETINFFEKYIQDKKMQRVLIVFADDDDGVSFMAGSEQRDYSFMEINWDLDCIKAFLMDGIE